jgi:hypothetical protein
MKKLLIGSDIHHPFREFKIPAEFVTETAGILARKGAGKTYTAQVMAEELLEHEQQIVAIDPLNVWWGLRSRYKVVIFGGDHADMPLEPHMGSTIADLVAENPDLSCVLSLRHLRKNKMRTFVTEFAENLFHRKASKSTPVHLFVDEADMFAPQRVIKGYERMLGAMEDLVRRGRTAGVGCTMITQRPQALHKDVLTQIELLVVGQITGPQDKKAIKEWIEHNADIQEQGMLMSSLAKLAVGQMWFWSPAFLNVFKKVMVRKKRTTDSSATPKAGKRVARMKARKIDLKAIRNKLESVVAEAESNDPKALKVEIARLKKELAAKVPAVVESAPSLALKAIRERIDQAVAKAIDERDDQWICKIKGLMIEFHELSVGALTDRLTNLQTIDIRPEKSVSNRGLVYTKEDFNRLKDIGVRAHQARVPRVPADVPNTNLPKPEFRILTVLAIRNRPCSRKLVALQAGYSPTSGGYAGALANLRKQDYINGSGSQIEITVAGREVLGPVDVSQLKSTTYWITKLKAKAAQEVFRAVLDAHPDPISRLEIAQRCNYSPTSGGFAGALAKLRGLELIVGYSDEIRLSPEILVEE